MAFPVINPILQFFDNSGNVLSGGKLFVYEPGTTTKKNTHSDENLSVLNANPIVLDSAGRCTIFLTDGEEYKFVLAPATDTDPPTSAIRTVDEVKSPSALTAANIGAGLYPRTAAEIGAGVTPVNYAYPPYNVLRYGNNTTPGTTDMSTAIQAAINSCPEGGEVVVPKVDGDYRIATGLTIAKALKFTGQGYGEDADTYPALIGDAGVNILSVGSATGARVEVTGISFNDGARGLVLTDFAHQCVFEKLRFADQTTCSFCDDADPAGTYIGLLMRDFIIRGSAKALEFNRVYNQFKFENGRITNVTGEVAVDLNNANPSHMSNVIFDFVIFESNQKIAIDADGIVLTLRNCHFEDNGTDSGGTQWPDIRVRRATGGSLKSSTRLDRCFFSTANANQSDERIHIVGPDVYMSIIDTGRPSGSKIVETTGSGSGVDLLIVDDPEAAGNWDIDTDISDVVHIQPASARMRLGGEGLRFAGTHYHRILRGTDTWDPGNLAAGASAETSITVTGAALGDVATASFSLTIGGMMMTAEVSAADTVRVVLYNRTAGAIDLASGTVRIYVWKETT